MWFQFYGRQGGSSKKLINEGDSDANFAYYCLHKLRMLPSQFMELDDYERAFVIAAIQIKIDTEKKKAKEAERKSKRKGR